MSQLRFAGFPDRTAYIPVPAAFFGTLLREIDDIAELKTCLHIWRLLHGQRRSPRFVQRSELLADRELLLALRLPDGDPPRHALARALKQATERGTLLAVAVREGDRSDMCYLINTSANRRVAREVAAGLRALGPLVAVPEPVEVGGEVARPTIFDLYEQNIGLLTPLLAEALREAEQAYPDDWIVDAFREAVIRNRRSWRYIERVLENWAAHGRGTGGEVGRRPEPPADSGRYLTGKYGRVVRR